MSNQINHLEQLKGEIVNVVGHKLNRLSEDVADLKGTTEALRRQCDELHDQRMAPGEPAGSTGSTLGQQLLSKHLSGLGGQQQEIGQLRRVAGRVSFSHEGGLFRPIAQTTVIDSSSVGSSTAGILAPQRVVPYVSAARRRLTLRDLLPVRETDASAVEFPQEDTFTNLASPQVEAAAKAESALTFTIQSAPVRTLAHWVPCSSQVLDDWGQLRRIVDESLLYGLKILEENEILTGNGTGQHLDGLLTQASSYAGTYDVGSDTKLDTLRHALLELEIADEQPDFIVLSPKDFHDIQLLKTEDSGSANTGNYLVGDPLGGAMQISTLWGRPVVSSNSMTAGEFLVGDSMQAGIYDRMQANILISTEHSDYFTRNLVAVRAEERIALAVYRGSAFLTGAF